MHAQLVLAQYLFKNNKEVRELSVMQANIWVTWKKLMEFSNWERGVGSCLGVQLFQCVLAQHWIRTIHRSQAIRDYILKQMKAMHKNLAMDPEPTTLQVQS